MDDIPIPPEVISALRVGTCCGCNKCLSKAFRDALKAWPGMREHSIQVPDDNSDDIRYTLKRVGIILPLTQEERDEPV